MTTTQQIQQLEERLAQLEESQGTVQFPLEQNSKGTIENTQFKQLKALQYFGGLPVYTSARTNVPSQGETYFKNITTPQLCSYIGGTEYCIPLSAVSGGWNFNGTFSSTGSQTVAWTAGTLYTIGGTNYSIVAGNTGSMTALTYIYFDSAVSTTVLQTTTTASLVVGSTKILIGVATPNSVTTGGSIFSDDFNSYTPGSIGGQGNWAVTAGTVTIQTGTVYEGANALKTGASGKASRQESLVNDGRQTFYVRGQSGAGGYIFLKEGGSGGSYKTWINVNADSPGYIAYYDNASGTFVNLLPWSINTWYAIQVEWRSSDHKVRFNVNGGAWTAYVTSSVSGSWVSGLDTIDIWDGLGTGNFFIDTIQGDLYSGDATFQIFGGSGGIKINGANVAQSSFSGNLLQAGSVPATALVGTDIATVGTITTGVWNGTIITSAYGGTGNGFTKFTGPATSEKTFTLPNANATIATYSDKLSVFAATTSAELAGVISNETGSGLLVFATSPTFTTSIILNGLLTTYNSITTAGWGVPSIYGSGRSTAQTAAVASVATYTVGASDGSFLISANVNITTSTAFTIAVQVDYTDETNTSRTLTLSFVQLAGTIINSITNLTGAGPYEGVPNQIRCKAATAITIKTTGTFTTVTYNVEGIIAQIS